MLSYVEHILIEYYPVNVLHIKVIMGVEYPSI
jgi:hypothetical protein